MNGSASMPIQAAAIPVKARRSLGLHIAMAYTILASANLLFFLAMIFENQSDILLQLFQYRSESLVQKIATDIQRGSLGEDAASGYEKIQSLLTTHAPREINLVNSEGVPIKSTVKRDSMSIKQFQDSILPRLADFKRADSLFESRYAATLDESNFSLNFILPITLGKGVFYANVVLDIQAMQDRLQHIYIQAGIAVAWVLAFHLALGIYVYRMLLRRVSSLTAASQNLASGDLTTRITWAPRGGDELDQLGMAFNGMAENLSSTIKEVKGLNRAIQAELTIGKTVQELIVGSASDFAAYKPFIHYRPLRQVSGDVYKFYEIGPGMHGMFFGDACGHGVSAALITSLVINFLDRIVATENNPGKIIRLLADQILATLQGSYYTTAVFILFHDESRRMFVCNAGHLPPLVLRKTGKLLQAGPGGPPAGVAGDFQYEILSLESRPGDRIFIYSDGMIEAMNQARDLYGFERFCDTIRANANEDLQTMGKAIIDDIDSFSQHFHDDATLIILEAP